jgi:hypothetical protein
MAVTTRPPYVVLVLALLSLGSAFHARMPSRVGGYSCLHKGRAPSCRCWPAPGAVTQRSARGSRLSLLAKQGEEDLDMSDEAVEAR